MEYFSHNWTRKWYSEVLKYISRSTLLNAPACVLYIYCNQICLRRCWQKCLTVFFYKLGFDIKFLFFFYRVNWTTRTSISTKKIPNRRQYEKAYYGNKETNCSPNGKNDILFSLLITSNALRKGLPEWQKWWENSFLR